MEIQMTMTDTLRMSTQRPEYTWRPLRREDLSALREMLLAIEQTDHREVADPLEDMQTQFDDPWSRPETDSLAAFTPAGQMVAFARTLINPQPETEIRAHIWNEVHPQHRQAGLEDLLLDWSETRNRQRTQSMPADLPRVHRAGVEDTQVDCIGLLERRGYQPVRYFYRMRRDLREPIPTKQLPQGLTLRTFVPDLSRRVLAALNEAFRDHWSYEAITEEDWQQFFLERSSFRPDCTYVVLEGDEVVGLSFNTVCPEENARRGIREGWVAELAVRRAWRNRGAATALLCESMRAFKADGLDYASLGVDTENPSGALRLYESLGFRPVKRFIQFSRPIA